MFCLTLAAQESRQAWAISSVPSPSLWELPGSRAGPLRRPRILACAPTSLVTKPGLRLTPPAVLCWLRPELTAGLRAAYNPLLSPAGGQGWEASGNAALQAGAQGGGLGCREVAWGTRVGPLPGGCRAEALRLLGSQGGLMLPAVPGEAGVHVLALVWVSACSHVSTHVPCAHCGVGLHVCGPCVCVSLRVSEGAPVSACIPTCLLGHLVCACRHVHLHVPLVLSIYVDVPHVHTCP